MSLHGTAVCDGGVLLRKKYECLVASASARRELRIIFKKELSKTDLPFRFCKIGLRYTLFIFGRKNGRLLLLLFCCNFVRFWLTLKKN